MRECNCCRKPVAITEASRFRTVVHADAATDVPYLYAALFECSCQNTLSIVLWQDEEMAEQEHADFVHEQEGAALYERDEAPLDRAAYRGFFSLTHELASRGL